MPIMVKGRESVTIPEGKHTGKISDIKQEARGKEGYEYLDVHVTVDGVQNTKGEDVTIKYGCPFDLTPNTKLGKLLMLFGLDKDTIVKEEEFDIEKHLEKGAEVEFMTIDEKSDRGKFARIVDDSLKPKGG